MSVASDREANAATAARRDKEFDYALTALLSKIEAEPVAAAVSFALAIAESMSATAAELTEAKRKGHVTASRDWRDAAMKVRGWAVGLEGFCARRPESATAPAPAPAPAIPLQPGEPAFAGQYDPVVAARYAAQIGDGIPGFTPPAPEPAPAPAVESPFRQPAAPGPVVDVEPAVTIYPGTSLVTTTIWVDGVPYPVGGWQADGTPVLGPPIPDQRPNGVEVGDRYRQNGADMEVGLDGNGNLVLLAPTQPVAEILAPAPVTTTGLPLEVVNPFGTPKAPGRLVGRLTYPQLAQLAAQLPGRENSSPSYVKSRRQCDMATTIGRLARRGLVEPEQPGFAALGGTALHLAIQRYEAMADEAGAALTAGEPILTLWTTALSETIAAEIERQSGGPYEGIGTWYASNGGRENYDWWRIEGHEMLRRYIDTHGPTWIATHQLAAAEWEYVLPLDDGSTSHGVIDQVWVDTSDSTLIIDDIKTGRLGRDVFQLGEYAWAVVKVRGVDPARVREVAYYNARTGERAAYSDIFDRVPWEAINYNHRAALSVPSMLPMANVTDMCGGCSAKALCPALR